MAQYNLKKNEIKYLKLVKMLQDLNTPLCELIVPLRFRFRP